VQEAVSIEEYRRCLLSGAGNAVERKGGKDWAPSDDGAQASYMLFWRSCNTSKS